jgi:putative hydrolase of the HAD superfamily
LKGVDVVTSKRSEERPARPSSHGEKSAIFDLDNTLYPARQYFCGAYREVAHFLHTRYGVDEESAYSQLLSTLESRTSTYPKIFDEALAKLKIDSPDIPSVLKVYGSYRGKLEPYSDVLPTLSKLKERTWKLGLITDGVPERQKRKLSMLRLERMFDVVIFAKSIASKPSPRAYSKALDLLSADPRQSFYVGDNPSLDFRGAKLAGLRTIRLLKGEFVRMPSNDDIDYEIHSLREVLRISESILKRSSSDR